MCHLNNTKEEEISSWQPISNETRDKLLGVWVSSAYSVDQQDNEASLKLEALLRLVVAETVSQGGSCQVK